MEIDARAEAWASLQLLPGVPPRVLAGLLKTLGGPEEVRGASRASLAKLVPVEAALAIERGPDPALLERTLSWIAEPGHALVAWDDADYPRALLTISDPPPAFYYSGRHELLNRPSIAIVGSRNATPQGTDNAEAFATTLSGAGFTIVSGLALGIDTAAHRGGLSAGGSSIAVMGTGPDRIYPSANRDLGQRLAAEGGVLSEFPLGTPPLPANFPRRNRLLSGLSRGVLVVEATLASGSLITARFAAEQGREVFAIPGSIHSPFSKGSHRLIKEGAKLVETAHDVLEELGAVAPPKGAGTQAPAPDVQGNAGRVLEALGHDPAGVDALTARTSLAAGAISVALVELELSGRVTPLPGGAFQRVR
ncbi:MAG TPA: DNA-processing protein DprA [Casimicrobiaceae bacterium]|nr:DNA-processing protein DprA [Casimicrobiaceae bacterium]